MNKFSKSLIVLVVFLSVLGMVVSIPHPGLLVQKSNSELNTGVNKFNYTTTKPGGSNKTLNNSLENQVMYSANRSKIPMKTLFIPNFKDQSRMMGNLVSSGYTSSPAPMGLAFEGICNVSGQNVGRNFTTSSFSTTLNMSRIQTANLADNAPAYISFQLNSILSNVVIHNNSGYQMWTQNVVDYNTLTHKITFVDNIWNFTSLKNISLPSSSFYCSSSPRENFSNALINVGPTLKTGSSFSITLYLNTSLINNRQAVYFNYTLQNSAGVQSGCYEKAVFNSTLPHENYKTPKLTYLVSGTTLNHFNLLYDAEAIIGGPGGGSTATILNITASLDLKYLNGTSNRYLAVPSAYDAGADTGETSSGVDVHSVTTNANLTTGPSLVYGLWNTTTSHSSKYAIKSSNTAGFIFVRVAKSATPWTWSPTNSDHSWIYLPSGVNYAVIAMENNHNMFGGNLTYLNSTSPTVINYIVNDSMSIYTPVYATNNTDLAQMAVKGSGTLSSPYVINANSNNSTFKGLNPVFGELNDYLFPEFAGLFLINTTAYVDVMNYNMSVSYSSCAYNRPSVYAATAIENSNGMNLWVYHSRNVSIINATVSAWYSNFTSGFSEGGITLWNSSHISVVDSSIISWGNGLLIYNNASKSSNIQIKNNLFKGISTVLNVQLNSSFWSKFIYGNSLIGILMLSNGVNVTGNEFLTQYTVISCSPANRTFTDLFSNNYFWDATTGLTYNDQGLMQTGEEINFMHIPGFNLTFETPETILNAVAIYAMGIAVTYEGLCQLSDLSANFIHTNTNQIQFISYMQTIQGYCFGTSGTISLSNGYTSSYVVKLFGGNAIFRETGLPKGREWGISANGFSGKFKVSTVELVDVTLGIYTYSALQVPGYTVNGSGQISLLSSSSIPYINIDYTTRNLSLTFVESGLAPGTQWSITINGHTQNISSDKIVLHGISVGSVVNYSVSKVNGYSNTGSSGKFYFSGNSTIHVQFISTSSNGFLFGAVMGAVITLAGAVLSYAIIFRRKPS